MQFKSRIRFNQFIFACIRKTLFRYKEMQNNQSDRLITYDGCRCPRLRHICLITVIGSTITRQS